MEPLWAGSALARDTYERVLAEVDRILMQDWDPIGVKHEPAAYDEYTTYAPGIIRLLLGGATEKRISDHLAMIEFKYMGLPGSAEQRSLATQKLLDVSLEGSDG